MVKFVLDKESSRGIYIPASSNNLGMLHGYPSALPWFLLMPESNNTQIHRQSVHLAAGFEARVKFG